MPAEAREDSGAVHVAILRRALASVVGAVALNAGDVAVRPVLAAQCDIDAIASAPDAPIDPVALPGEEGGHGVREGVAALAATLRGGARRGWRDGRGGGVFRADALRVFEERLEVRGAHRLCAPAFARVDLRGADGGEHDYLLLRPRDRDVEAAFAARQVERAEVHGEAPFLVGRVAYGKEYHVALVALHVLQVLHEVRSLAILRQQPLQFWVGGAALLQHRPDQLLLRHGERDDADGAAAGAAAAHLLADVIDQRPGLRLVHADFPAGPREASAGHELEFDAERGRERGGGEGAQAV